MKLGLVYDTETSDMPKWGSPSDAPEQPHIVELGAIVVDLDTYRLVHRVSVIVRPDGWDFDPEAGAVHGITHEHAMAVGIPEPAALSLLLDLWRACAVRIGYNESFDARIVRIALKRYQPDLAEEFKAAPAECCMQQVMQVLACKRLKLTEAYKTITGRDLVDAHSAFADAMATAELHQALRGRVPA